MKVTRLVIGIISFVMALIVTFQSCFAGLGNAMEDNGEVGGSAGVVLAVFAIVAGIIAIVTRKGEGKGPFVAGGFYLAGGIIGLAMAGSYADLKSLICSFSADRGFFLCIYLTIGYNGTNL